jgi:hypothetical protein
MPLPPDDAEKAPPQPEPNLEVFVVRGVGGVVHGNEKIACYAVVLTPEPGCMTSSGKSIICDRVLRFYDASTAMKSHRPVAEGEKVTLQKQGDNTVHLLAGSDVYAIQAPEGKRLDIKWGDFSSMDNQSSMDRRQAISKYVMKLLKKQV